MERRDTRLAAIAAAPLLLATSATADLIGVPAGFPQLFADNQGFTLYDAVSDLLTADGTPAALRFGAAELPRLVSGTGDPPTEFASIRILVGAGGNLIGGVPGDDLMIVGEVDQDGDGVPDYGGILLTGEVVEFGHLDVGEGSTTDIYDFRFVVTGGSLAPLFEGLDIGAVVTSEMSSFEGDFTDSFDGEAKIVVGSLASPSQGACCFPDGSCKALSQDDCQEAGGLFQGDGSTCRKVVCTPPKGACCLASGACGVLTQAECAMFAGQYQGDGTLCQRIDCPLQEEACCFLDGGCALVMRDDCLMQGGLPQGPGTDCAGAPCPQMPEACCFPGGACAVIMPGTCLELGGLPQGPETGCAPNDCPQEPEACCFDDGICAMLSQNDCLAQGGLPQGEDTVCMPNECVQPKGACCFEDDSCGTLTQDDCNEAGGNYQGDGTTCRRVVCR